MSARTQLRDRPGGKRSGVLHRAIRWSMRAAVPHPGMMNAGVVPLRSASPLVPAMPPKLSNLAPRSAFHSCMCARGSQFT